MKYEQETRYDLREKHVKNHIKPVYCKQCREELQPDDGEYCEECWAEVMYLERKGVRGGRV